MTAAPARALIFAGWALLSVAGCSRDRGPIPDSRYAGPDRLYQTVEANVRANPAFEVIVDIDHSRLAEKAGSSMPPAHVLIWSDPKLEADLLRHSHLAAIDLPLRVLAFEDQESGQARVIANGFDYLVNRYALPDDPALRARYDAAIAAALEGVPADAVARFPSDAMPDAGLVIIDSPFDFATTGRRIRETIDAQSDTVVFGEVDFAERSRREGVTLRPMRLILFGGPGPGGKAMASAPTLGLDAFCQKLLIWEDADGAVHVAFNDLLALADRQQVSGGLPLRFINRRLKKTFSDALAP